MKIPVKETVTSSVDLTVLVATMPSREAMLPTALASIEAQLVKPADVRVRCEAPGELGPNPAHLAHQHNVLREGVTTEWVQCLDDDDELLPEHFATIAPFLTAEADVIFTWPTEPVILIVDVTGWPTGLVLEQLRAHNFIPSNAVIRRSALEAVGGWSEDYDLVARRFRGTGCTWEDWDLWTRMAMAGARFVTVPAMTWRYGQHEAQSQRVWAE